MSPDAMLAVLNRAIWTAAECVGPLLVIGGATGLVMAVLQAATSVNENSLTFVPKLAALGGAFVLMGSWIVDKLVAFNVEVYEMIAAIGR
ncbi:MAG: flagellar biosynthetic protein FliQ [Myxococcales bacterium FL481]|nr:MAG: flagellar biosynthetic protein FliQ [Myxococcales bacterium FL481]